MTATSETATVEVLTAEVRVLQVGRRQITLSVYRQLDRVWPQEIRPFGRVNDGDHDYVEVAVIGRHRDDGTLVKSYIGTKTGDSGGERWWPRVGDHRGALARLDELASEWAELPLIVLAGLR